MATIAETNAEEDFLPALEKAAKALDGSQNEAVFNLSQVRRLDSHDLRELEEFVRTAEEKKIKIVLRGVNVDLYKTLKLAKLDCKFVFLN